MGARGGSEGWERGGGSGRLGGETVVVKLTHLQYFQVPRPNGGVTRALDVEGAAVGVHQLPCVEAGSSGVGWGAGLHSDDLISEGVVACVVGGARMFGRANRMQGGGGSRSCGERRGWS